MPARALKDVWKAFHGTAMRGRGKGDTALSDEGIVAVFQGEGCLGSSPEQRGLCLIIAPTYLENGEEDDRAIAQGVA